MNNRQKLIMSIFVIAYSCAVLYFYVYYKIYHPSIKTIPVFIKIIGTISAWALPFLLIVLLLMYLSKNK